MTTNLSRLILDSKALSIWNHKTGPVFWYAASVPGPFYLNTEQMIGRALSETLLEKITAVIAENAEPVARAAALQATIMAAYKENADFQTVIRAMIEKAKQEFPAGSYSAISGGERRDWLFSIPFAVETGGPHIYLFKNKTSFCAPAVKTGGKVLHISDLINNAASYFDMWLPMLSALGMQCAGTLTVNTRSSVGIKRLEEAGYKVAALNCVDLSFFEKSAVDGLIGKDTLDELAIYFTSEKEWAARYVMRDEKIFAIETLDKKSFERMASFFTQDPWGLREQHKAFFTAMLDKIATRKAA